jgi:hypothetical protein
MWASNRSLLIGKRAIVVVSRVDVVEGVIVHDGNW